MFFFCRHKFFRIRIKSTMDLNLVTLLKSVAAAEKNLDFRTQTYEVGSLELKHPRNVITVAPPFGNNNNNAPPCRSGETRATKLSFAVRAALLRALNGGPNGRAGCSIVVHEGVYIDAWETSISAAAAAWASPTSLCGQSLTRWLGSPHP